MSPSSGIDFGSQVTQLIVRPLRESGCIAGPSPFQQSRRALNELRPGPPSSSGGPARWPTKARRARPGVFGAGVPVLGICYDGQQIHGHQLGGRVQPHAKRAFGARGRSR